MNKLTIYVYKSIAGDCTNGGISASTNTLNLLMSDDERPQPVVRYGNDEIEYFRAQAKRRSDHDPEHDVFVVKRHLSGRDYYHIEPIEPVRSGCVGYMAGGNLAYTSDHRFRSRFDYALPIHDRQETHELYEVLSR